jgi:hypothetical protein
MVKEQSGAEAGNRAVQSLLMRVMSMFATINQLRYLSIRMLRLPSSHLLASVVA